MGAIPDKFKFLNDIGVLPKMIEVGIQYLGIRELPGKEKNNPVIMDMAKSLGIAKIYPNDETAWCGLAQCKVCVVAGKPMLYKQYEILRAASFNGGGSTKPKAWGNPVQKGDEKLGDILVFEREGGGHVGMYIAETDTTFFVMGGNQGNSYSITEIAKSRLVAARRYYKTGPPASVKKYKLTTTGVVSVNEA